MKQRMIICGVLVVLIFAAHAPALRGTFVWDDTALVLRDPLIRSWRLIPEGFQHFLFVDATPSNFYRPVQRLTYTLEYWAFAFRPAPYHLTNILLHAATTIALFTFALAFFRLYRVDERKSLGVAAIASLAWALHPLHSGVVDYVSGRADSLAALFGFAALYFTVRALGQAAAWKFYAITGFALLASALSKETGLVFSALAITLILLTKNWKGLAVSGVAIAFVLTIYVTLRSQVPPVNVPQLSPPAPALVRPIIAARALAEYAGLSYLPVCGLFSLNANIAEHWIYVPLAFILLAVALQVALIVRPRAAFLSVIALATLWIAFLGLRTFYRAQDWQDPRTFFGRTIGAGGDSARMLSNLGALDLSDGHLEQADMLFQRALSKNPEQPFALLNLG